jgi:cytochrome c oxidase cbb3-type subunit II
MDIFNNHSNLFLSALGLFLLLTIVIAIIPALENQTNNAPLPNAQELGIDELAGKQIFIANGCVACHTQQVRNVDMDKMWGSRPSIAADYALAERTDIWRNTATLMGTERTGPDLTDIGNRQPSLAWHLLHLYQPRAVVAQSIMPAYPWLFEVKESVSKEDIKVNLPEKFRKNQKGHLVATKEALQLVAYLQSLKQTPLPNGKSSPQFLYKKEQASAAQNEDNQLPNGLQLYTQNCQSCHQANGEGLKGAFPPLKGSKIVTGDNLELFVGVIMQGYDAREEYAMMPAVGKNNQFSPEQVTAIINHERSSWGNNASKVSLEEVKKIMNFIQENPKK